MNNQLTVMFLSAFHQTYFNCTTEKLWHKDSCNVRSESGSCECGYSLFAPIYERIAKDADEPPSKGGAR